MLHWGCNIVADGQVFQVCFLGKMQLELKKYPSFFRE